LQKQHSHKHADAAGRYGSSMDTRTQHKRIDVAGVDTFYREAGDAHAPVVLLPHGYPCSSYEFRNLLPRLADRWRLLAPDYPGAGHSATPERYDYSFDGYAAFLDAFVTALGVERFVLYLHDFGSPIGARLAIRRPDRIVGLIIQNGDIPYEDALGPKYADIERTWSLPEAEMRRELAKAITEDTFREEFLNDVDAEVARRIPPDLWRLHWSLVTPRRKEIAVDLIAGLKQNRAWFPEHRRYLREHRPPTLIVWGPRDHYMPEVSARAYLRDLPDAELHLLRDAGHWLLETHLDEAVELMRAFLGRVHSD
jgi:pimeloyl-ACP methyl ester carboxylesterase